MYNTSFYINKPISNNSFSYNKRWWRDLFVPRLISWTLDDLGIWKEVVFEECDKNWKIISFHWLENFIKTEIYWIPTYIFDNHNHAFFFWFKSLYEQKISTWATLVHIDEHSDLAEPSEYLKTNATLQDIFEYTNSVLNVWNYILPAINSWLVRKLIKVTWESELDNLMENIESEKNDIILNLDVDFFSPWMDYIDYWKKKKLIQETAKKSKLITIATSPFFIEQDRAIKVIKDIFKN